MGETAVPVKRGSKAAAATVKKKATKVRDPFERFDDIYEQIARRAFDIFQAGGGMHGHDVEDWIQAEAQFLHPTRIKVSETSSGVSVEAEVPGFEARDLAVGLEGRRLTITGKHESKKDERRNGKGVSEKHCVEEILRAIELPADVDPDKAAAALKGSMLRVQMPKTDKPKSAQVRVKVA